LEGLMAANVEMEWIDEGFKEILNCDKLSNVCFNTAKEIASTANAETKGTPYKAERWHSNMKGGRTAALVTGNLYGDRKEAKDKTLSRAVSTCRKS
jgi:hypothetical protein